MTATPSFERSIAAKLWQLAPVERRVAEFFRQNREEVLVASAAELAEKIGTSDATIVRTTRSLGYSGLAELRRALADELRARLSPAVRMARTLGAVRGNLGAAFRLTIDTHLASLERLRLEVTADLFDEAVTALTTAKRVAIFGIGPSSAMATYFAIQLARFGIEATALMQTGLLHADELHRLRSGDKLVMLAYTRLYREIDALIDRAQELGLGTMLLTDSLGPIVSRRVDLVLPVARGRSDMFSMHTATLALIEALLVGVAARRQRAVIAELGSLNRLREKLAGGQMDLPTNPGDASSRQKQRRSARTKPRR